MQNRARVAIVGTGAMGSVYAALMADAGHDVWAVDQWADHVAAMREKGLRVEGFSGDRTVKVNATTDVAEVGEADLVVIATKLDGVQAAAEAVKPILEARTRPCCRSRTASAGRTAWPGSWGRSASPSASSAASAPR